MLIVRNVWVGIFGWPWKGDTVPRDLSEQKVRLRFTCAVLFSFNKLAYQYQHRYVSDGNPKAVVIDVDVAKELCKDYSRSKADRTRYSTCVYPPAKLLVHKLFNRAICCPTIKNVIFLAGGTASGKSSAVAAYAERSREYLIMDGTFSDVKVCSHQVWTSLAQGKKTLILYVFTPLDIAMSRALDRALERGRVVPLSTFAQTHFKSQKTVEHIEKLHPNEINLIVRAVEFPKNPVSGKRFPTMVSFETIQKYESIDYVRQRTFELFEAEISYRRNNGKPVPIDIENAFRKEGRKVG